MRGLLEAFNRWFSSSAGVYQTLVLVLIIVLLERIFPRADQHGFWLLYWLTVYSAVTQPILAYVARMSGEKEQALLERMEAIENHCLSLLEAQGIPHEHARRILKEGP